MIANIVSIDKHFLIQDSIQTPRLATIEPPVRMVSTPGKPGVSFFARSPTVRRRDLDTALVGEEGFDEDWRRRTRYMASCRECPLPLRAIHCHHKQKRRPSAGGMH
ncbi:hypothetical protein [Devosia sp. DBB001]|nr:hypothetical protein [Devosia sp. DBB001]